MLLINQMQRRPRGRPQVRPDSETKQLMIEAAEREFQANGYAGTSMTAVAHHTGVSTKTMYRLIPTKADLFREVIAYRTSRVMLAFAVDACDAKGVRDALARLLTAYGELSLSKEAVAVHRLVLAESGRFPELAGLLHEGAIRGTGDAIAAWLRRHQERGLIRMNDALVAAGMLRGMMAMEPQRAIMLGLRSVPDVAEIAVRATQCADLFLDGCLL